MIRLQPIVIVWVWLVLFLASCNVDEDNDHSFLYDNAYEIDMATVHKEENGYSLESDKYGMLTLTNTDLLTHYDVDKEGQRVLAYFLFDQETTRDESSSIKLLNVNKVLTKELYDMPAEKEDSIGNDPITISQIYASNYHLNIFFTFLGSNSAISHMVNLITTEERKITEDGLLEVEFRHNLNGDSEVYPQSGWVSFELKSIQEFNEKSIQGLNLKVHTDDHTIRYYPITWKDAQTKGERSPLSFGDFSGTQTK